MICTLLKQSDFACELLVGVRHRAKKKKRRKRRKRKCCCLCYLKQSFFWMALWGFWSSYSSVKSWWWLSDLDSGRSFSLFINIYLGNFIFFLNLPSETQFMTQTLLRQFMALLNKQALFYPIFLLSMFYKNVLRYFRKLKFCSSPFALCFTIPFLFLSLSLAPSPPSLSPLLSPISLFFCLLFFLSVADTAGTHTTNYLTYLSELNLHVYHPWPVCII